MSRVYIMKNGELKLIVSSLLPDALPLNKLILHEEINGLDYIIFAVPSSHPDAKQIQIGDWAVIKDPDGIHRAFVIVEQDRSDNGQGDSLVEFRTEELAYNELNDHIVEDVRPTFANGRLALTKILEGSLWSPGIVETSGNKTFNVYYEPAIAGIQKMIDKYKCEVRFRVSLDSTNRVVGRYVDLLSRLGTNRGKRFEWGKDITGIEQFSDGKPLKTALYGRGKGEETDSGGYGRRITFKDVVWSVDKGDPVDKPFGQEWVGDPNALAQYGHINLDGTRRHKYGVYINEEQTDPVALLQETYDYLKSLTQPQVSFKVKVQDLEQVSSREYAHEAVRIGDTCYVIVRKNNWDVEVTARVMEIDRDLLLPENSECVIGNVLAVVTDLIKDVQTEVEKKVGMNDPIGWLQGVIDAARSEFHSNNGYVYITDKDGILITNRPKDNIDNLPDKAIQLKSAGLAISSSRNPDGTWNWTTFVTGDQVIADCINAGRIRTDNVQIGDAGGQVLISGGNITIKGGGLEVYSTPDASDSGVMIKGNKISTNFIKNNEFLRQPNETTDWQLYPGVKYDAATSKITVDCSTTMNFIGINQTFDVYHPKATFQALFKTNLIGGTTPKSCRIVIYNYDSKGNQLATNIKTETFSLYQEKLLLTMPVTFPVGTVRSKLWVQVEMDYNMTNGMEILWVKGSYDDLVTQDQLRMYPKDVYNLDSNPEIQMFAITVNVGSNLVADTVYNIGRINFDRTFSPISTTGRIICLLQPHSSNSNAYQAVSFGIDNSGFTLSITTNRAIPSGTTLTIHGLAYRVDYYASITKSL